MKVWIDTQLPPSLARLLSRDFGVEASHLIELGLAGSKDEVIFLAARAAGADVITKDADFVRLLEQRGPPPKVLWITLGNASNRELAQAIKQCWQKVCTHFESGEPLVELGRSPDKG